MKAILLILLFTPTEISVSADRYASTQLCQDVARVVRSMAREVAIESRVACVKTTQGGWE